MFTSLPQEPGGQVDTTNKLTYIEGRTILSNLRNLILKSSDLYSSKITSKIVYL